MPVQTRFTDGGKGAVVRHTGMVEGDQIMLVLDKIFLSRDLAAEPIYYVLIEHHETTGVTLSTQDVKRAAALQISASQQMPETATVIAVYAGDDVMFGLARMWEAHVNASGWDTQVFRDRAEAVRWLQGRVAERFGFDASVE
jgi:hypothetical protein